MAAYFLGTSSEEIGGRHAVQARIPMNTSYLGYSDINQQQPPLLQDGNFVFLNHPNFSENDGCQVMPHAPSSHDQHHFLGIPLQAGANAITSPSSASGHDLHGFLHPRVNYNLYALPVDLGPPARDVARTPRGLSLSLSSQQPSSGYGWSFRFERDDGLQQAQTQRISARADDDVRVSMGPLSSSSMEARNNVSGVRSVFPSSKYLKVTQELLDEVVNVGRWPRCRADPPKAQATSSRDASSPVAMSVQGQGGGKSGTAAELTTPERQEIQMKKAKLVNMLDEVEQRYRQYHHHMQTVISCFDQAAGVGSAKTYTAVALQTISKHFRCLKDAIIRQINAAGKSVGGAENADGKMEGSRLKYVGNQIRQQRALQQMGIIQHNAWRPQRGLPERSVTVLRAWLFEHFLHPYPKDLDKVMLAKQTGLTRSQVSNWFINARVRLWKPMVEEMYVEEMREHEKNGLDENNKTSKIEHFTCRANNPSTSPPEIEAPAAAQQSPKKFGFEAETPACEDEGGFGLIGGPANFIAGFGEYSMSELGRFNGSGGLPYPGNVVSLTLGPPHGENISPHQTFLQPAGRQIEEAGDFGRLNGRPSTDMYEEAKGFEPQLLPDFVA